MDLSFSEGSDGVLQLTVIIKRLTVIIQLSKTSGESMTEQGGI